MNPTTDELRETFRRCGLWRLGWSFQQAMEAPLVRQALALAATARNKQNTAAGQAAPLQPRLI